MEATFKEEDVQCYDDATFFSSKENIHKWQQINNKISTFVDKVSVAD